MRSLVGVGGEWLGIHRGLGGAHRPYPLLRHRHAWVQSAGVAAMAVVTGASIWLLLSGAALPTRDRGPIILPAISVPRLLSPGPAGTSSKRSAPPSTATPAGRAPGSHPLITPDSPSASTSPSAPPPSLVPELAPAPPPATSRPPCPPTKRHGKPSPLPTPHR